MGGGGEGGVMMYVSRMNFNCDGFAFGRVGHILVSILPILMSFVAISSVLCRYFNQGHVACPNFTLTGLQWK